MFSRIRLMIFGAALLLVAANGCAPRFEIPSETASPTVSASISRSSSTVSGSAAPAAKDTDSSMQASDEEIDPAVFAFFLKIPEKYGRDGHIEGVVPKTKQTVYVTFKSADADRSVKTLDGKTNYLWATGDVVAKADFNNPKAKKLSFNGWVIIKQTGDKQYSCDTLATSEAGYYDEYKWNEKTRQFCHKGKFPPDKIPSYWFE